MNIGLPSTKKKLQAFQNLNAKICKISLNEEQAQLIEMANSPMSAIQVFQNTYNELKAKRDIRNKYISSVTCMKGIKHTQRMLFRSEMTQHRESMASLRNSNDS